MNIIFQNPFRVLGIPVTASERDIAKSFSDLSIYTKMGKIKEYECDNYFSIKPQRTFDVIHEACQKIEKPNSRLLYALFWFWHNPTNTFDMMAFEELKTGNTDKAIEFWERACSKGVTTNNGSNFKNLSVLYMGLACENGRFDKTLLEKSLVYFGTFISNGQIEPFADYVTGSYSNANLMEVANLYVQEVTMLAKPYLEQPDGFKSKEFLGCFSTFPKKYKALLRDEFTSRYAHNINRQIELCKSLRKDKRKANKAGFGIFYNTKEDLSYLKSVLSESDVEYQLLADNLAEEILDCSICYFNELRYGETDPGDDALLLAQYAKTIAVGAKVTERIEKNLPVIQEYVSEKPKRQKFLPVKKEYDGIYKRISDFEEQIGETAVPKDIKLFLAHCKAELLTIRDHLGVTDKDYLEINNTVAVSAMGLTCVFLYMEIQKISGNRYAITARLAEVYEIFALIEQLDISGSTKREFNELCSKFRYKQTAKQSSSEGCYIATMVYGSYNSPEVFVLRKFRDQVLMRSWAGAAFVKLYYKVSPGIVKKVKHCKKLHILLRKILNSFVSYLKEKV
jgi:hypothetical protein